MYVCDVCLMSIHSLKTKIIYNSHEVQPGIHNIHIQILNAYTVQCIHNMYAVYT